VELDLSAEQEAMQEAARSWLSRECSMQFVRDVVEHGASPARMWRGIVEMEWPGLAVDSSVGGLGMGPAEIVLLAEELGRSVAPGPLIVTAAGFFPLVEALGSVDQRERFISRMLRNGSSGTLGICPATCQAPEQTREGWILHGVVPLVVSGGEVDEIAVVSNVGARSSSGSAKAKPSNAFAPGLGLDPERDIGVWIVPSDPARISSVRTLDWSRNLASVDLEGVVVEPERCLLGDSTSTGSTDSSSGEIDQLAGALDLLTVAFSAEIVGACTRIFEIALQYVKDREQFGVKVGSFQAVKHKFADLFMAIQAAEATVYFAAAALAERDGRAPLGSAMAKIMAGECARRCCQEGIQSLGGIGYTWEHDMHLYVKRAMSDRMIFGTEQAHRDRIAVILDLSGEALSQALPV